MLARDKHSSLLRTLVNYGRKTFYNIGPWDNVRDILTSDKILLSARVFVPGKPFQPSLIFVGKAGASPSEAPFRYSTLG
jgi:hypothetical protein